VYDAISEGLPGVSRATVYRVLELFVSLGVARKIAGPEAKARFDADTGRHHHIRCDGCGTVIDFHDDLLNALPYPPVERTGFVINDYSVSFSGTCARCRGTGG
jgi:Fur family peroxide stress response transcriptional regulator